MPTPATLIGQRLGVYQVRALLGVGGMGEVYRARDSRLGRDVAIKILPPDVAGDPDRLARFEREARVLASLNHPHIGAIYGFEDAATSDGHHVRGLVLELIEGDTLADRLTRGALPMPEALALARRIADALDAAHQQGIIHRDLKPANVKVTPAGRVKVLDLPADRQSTERLVSTPFGGVYASRSATDGHVLFVRDGALMAMPFDADRRVTTSEPTTVASGVGSFRDGAMFAAAGNALVYREGAPAFQLTWLDRRGVASGLVGEPADVAGSALSPDGTRVIARRASRLGRSSWELWLVDVLRNTSTPFATAPEPDAATWSPDGKDVDHALGSRGASINRKPADGNRPAETVLREGGRDGPMYAGGTAIELTRDGRFLVFTVEAKGTLDLWLLPLAAGAKALPLVQQEFDQTDGRVSPDGRWLAYLSNESGAENVFIRPLTSDAVTGVPIPGSSQPVSSGGARSPRWRKDGRELFFHTRAGAVMAVTVEGTTVGTPTELFRAPGMQREWSVSADGQHFLVAVPSRQDAPAFTVVVNWQSALKN